MKNIKAILFDFDGVLVDSMEENYLAWQIAFKKYGVKINRDDYFPFEGLQLLEVAEQISANYGLNGINYKEIIDEKERIFPLYYKFKLFDGVEELVDNLKERKRLLAIVSAGHKKRLFDTTPHNFLRKFDYIVTGDEIKNGKPSPEPYITAMDGLKVSCKQCIVLENAPLGIRSAKNAGIYCIGICSTLDKKLLNEADEIVEKFNNLKGTKVLSQILNER